MSDPFFFGYGSLVNRATHDYPRAARARVRGWRRRWTHTKLRPVAFLSVVEAPGEEIDGLIASVPGGDWNALDQREAAYLRLPVEEIDHPHDGVSEVQIYRTRPEHDAAPSEAFPVLLSYLDTVAQGFLREFGEDGLLRFFATTEGWDAPVLDDREAPRYARAQRLAREEIAMVDDLLAQFKVRRVAA